MHGKPANRRIVFTMGGKGGAGKTPLLSPSSLMPDNEPPQSSIILYQPEDGHTRVQCRFEDEMIWLTQAQIAELFQATPQNVTLHLKAIFAEGSCPRRQLVRITYKFARKALARHPAACAATA